MMAYPALSFVLPRFISVHVGFELDSNFFNMHFSQHFNRRFQPLFFNIFST